MQVCSDGHQLVRSHRTGSLRPVAAAAAEVDTDKGIATTILLPDCQLAFGDRVKAVGEIGALGHWDVNDAQELQWSEGHNWQLDLVLPAGQVDFKVRAMRDSAQVACLFSGFQYYATLPGLMC